MTLDAFMCSSLRNSWVEEPGFSRLYVRKGLHYANGRKMNTLDLASFEVRHKGRGVFTRFVAGLGERFGLPLFVESVLNDRLAMYLPTIGFSKVLGSAPPCFIKE